MTAAVLVLAATAAHAGPIRDRLAARFSRPSCGACHLAPAVAPGLVRQAGAAVAVAEAGLLVRSTSYDGLGVPVDAAPYQSIRLASPLSPCANGVCR